MNTRLRHAGLALAFSFVPVLTAPLHAGDAIPKGLSAADWHGIRAEYERHRLEAFRVGNEYHARNPRQQMLARFDGHGFTVEPQGAGWKWGLELEGMKGPAQVRTDGNRTTYKWNSSLEEWFVNDERGLDHGFTLYSPIRQGEDHIALRLRVRGGLQPRVHSDHLGADVIPNVMTDFMSQHRGKLAFGSGTFQKAGIDVNPSTTWSKSIDLVVVNQVELIG